MTLEELIALYRAQSRDDTEPYFCSDELLASYASEGQDEACRRGQLIRDAASPLCTITYSAGDESVPVDPRIVQVLLASVDGYPVDMVAVEQMDAIMPAWASAPAAVRPNKLVTGLTTGRMHLWPTPNQPGQIKLRVLRMPLKKLVNDNDKPEIRPETHPALVEWMLYRAYSRDDTDLHNDGKAAIALAKFEAEFGRKASGRNEQWVRNGAAEGPSPIA